jgi:hypothetical protein
MIVALLLTIVLLLLYWKWCVESFLPCEGCDDVGLFVAGTDKFAGLPAINPYTWPYSGTADLSDLYVANLIRSDRMPLTHLSAPDHVLLTN